MIIKNNTGQDYRKVVKNSLNLQQNYLISETTKKSSAITIKTSICTIYLES